MGWPAAGEKNHGFEPHIGKILLLFFVSARPRVRAPYRELGNLNSSSLLSVRLVLPDGEPEIGSLRLRSPSIVGCFLFPAASRRMHLRNSSGLRLHRPPHVSSWGGIICVSLHLPVSPRISLHLPASSAARRSGWLLPISLYVSPCISLHLLVSPCISLTVPRREEAAALDAREPAAGLRHTQQEGRQGQGQLEGSPADLFHTRRDIGTWKILRYRIQGKRFFAKLVQPAKACSPRFTPGPAPAPGRPPQPHFAEDRTPRDRTSKRARDVRDSSEQTELRG